MNTQRPSVLLVDDDSSVRKALALLLEREGCRIDMAADGEEALRKLRKNRYTAIFLDLLMPRVNGFEVLQDLKALNPEVLPDVAVLTGASDKTLAWFDDQKIYGLLRKPVDQSEVLQVIDGCAKRHGVSRDERSRAQRLPRKTSISGRRISLRSQS